MRGIAWSLFDIAHATFVNKQEDKALSYYQEAFSIFEDIGMSDEHTENMLCPPGDSDHLR